MSNRIPNALLAAFAAAILILAGYGLMALADGVQGVAYAEPLKAATPEPIDACPEWRTAGAQVIYKCVDDDDHSICYIPVAGVMQCLKD